jgi:hypothetical protein
MKIVVLTASWLLVLGSLRAEESFLPAPTGSYLVGRHLFAWTDPARPANLLKASAARRELAVWVWYPAKPIPSAPIAEWAPGKVGEAVFSELIKPPVRPTHKRTDNGAHHERPTNQVMHSLTTHSCPDAPISSAEKKYPLLVFAPGLGEQPTSYADLIEDLVSHGYIVAGIVPTDYVRVVVYPDGRARWAFPLSSRALGYRDEEEARYGLAAPIWAADMRFVLNQLEKLNQDPKSDFSQRMDFSRVGTFGHSFGGSTSVQVALEDSRVKAAIDIDGKIHGTVTQEGLAKPYMCLRSDQTERRDALEKLAPGDFERARYAGMERDFQFVYEGAKPGYGILLRGSVHMFPSDGGLVPFVPEDKKFAETGPIGAHRAHVITKAYLEAFFGQHLKGQERTLLRGPSPFAEVSFERTNR